MRRRLASSLLWFDSVLSVFLLGGSLYLAAGRRCRSGWLPRFPQTLSPPLLSRSRVAAGFGWPRRDVPVMCQPATSKESPHHGCDLGGTAHAVNPWRRCCCCLRCLLLPRSSSLAAAWILQRAKFGGAGEIASHGIELTYMFLATVLLATFNLIRDP